MKTAQQKQIEELRNEMEILLKCVRWLIQRDSMKPEFRSTFDDALVNKVDEILYKKPIKSEKGEELVR